ncbi:MAG: hypothetical protein DRQ44_01585 [Gammaproteobacteria bacterium]|nr:MAG: hypothetical protein DRQ44_01585 [Gammaproteobacteria bacterium]
MADNDFSKNFDVFLKMQSQYMDMWKTTNLQTVEPSMQNPWASIFTNAGFTDASFTDFWSTPPEQSTAASSLFGNMFQQNVMMTQLAKCFEVINNIKDGANQQSSEQWQSSLNQALDDLKSQLTNFTSTPFSASPDMTNSWNEAASHWQKTMQAHHFSIPDSANNFASSPLPGLGPNREQYEQLKNLQLHMETFQATQQEYTQSFSEFWPEVIDKLKIKITDAVEQEDENLTSIHALFSLWTDAAESVYAKTTQADNHQKGYSELLNASMALKKAVDDIRQDALAKLNMPTRKEIDTLSERLQRTCRENRLLRNELNELKTAFESSLKAPDNKRKSTTKNNGPDVMKNRTKKVKKTKNIKKKMTIKKPK